MGNTADRERAVATRQGSEISRVFIDTSAYLYLSGSSQFTPDRGWLRNLNNMAFLAAYMGNQQSVPERVWLELMGATRSAQDHRRIQDRYPLFGQAMADGLFLPPMDIRGDSGSVYFVRRAMQAAWLYDRKHGRSKTVRFIANGGKLALPGQENMAKIKSAHSGEAATMVMAARHGAVPIIDDGLALLVATYRPWSRAECPELMLPRAQHDEPRSILNILRLIGSTTGDPHRFFLMLEGMRESGAVEGGAMGNMDEQEFATLPPRLAGLTIPPAPGLEYHDGELIDVADGALVASLNVPRPAPLILPLSSGPLPESVVVVPNGQVEALGAGLAADVDVEMTAQGPPSPLSEEAEDLVPADDAVAAEPADDGVAAERADDGVATERADDGVPGEVADDVVATAGVSPSPALMTQQPRLAGNASPLRMARTLNVDGVIAPAARWADAVTSHVAEAGDRSLLASTVLARSLRRLGVEAHVIAAEMSAFSPQRFEKPRRLGQVQAAIGSSYRGQPPDSRDRPAELNGRDGLFVVLVNNTLIDATFGAARSSGLAVPPVAIMPFDRSHVTSSDFHGRQLGTGGPFVVYRPDPHRPINTKNPVLREHDVDAMVDRVVKQTQLDQAALNPRTRRDRTRVLRKHRATRELEQVKASRQNEALVIRSRDDGGESGDPSRLPPAPKSPPRPVERHGSEHVERAAGPGGQGSPTRTRIRTRRGPRDQVGVAAAHSSPAQVSQAEPTRSENITRAVAGPTRATWEQLLAAATRARESATRSGAGDSGGTFSEADRAAAGSRGTTAALPADHARTGGPGPVPPRYGTAGASSPQGRVMVVTDGQAERPPSTVPNPAPQDQDVPGPSGSVKGVGPALNTVSRQKVPLALRGPGQESGPAPAPSTAASGSSATAIPAVSEPAVLPEPAVPKATAKESPAINR